MAGWAILALASRSIAGTRVGTETGVENARLERNDRPAWRAVQAYPWGGLEKKDEHSGRWQVHHVHHVHLSTISANRSKPQIMSDMAPTPARRAR